MKYFTKELYINSQLSGLGDACKVYEGTEKKDEELYKMLYKLNEKKFVDYEMMNLGSFKINPSDYEYWKKRFNKKQKSKIEHINSEYPLSIIEQIVDIRVFALGYCSKELLQAMADFEDELNKKDKLASETYFNLRKDLDLPSHIDKGLNFHDCRVETIEEKDDLIMKFESKSIYNEMSSITFHSAKVIKNDNIGKDDWYLYDEIYRIEGGYEVHILFDKNNYGSNRELGDFIVECKDMSFS